LPVETGDVGRGGEAHCDVVAGGFLGSLINL